MAKTIAICNQKGGTGKTTTSINLSVYLAVEGARTLLIDADPQGNSTSGLGLDKNSIEKSIYHLLIDHTPIKEVIHKTEIENLSLIPSNIDLIGAEVELVDIENRERKLKTSLESIDQEYDYIVIDCP